MNKKTMFRSSLFLFSISLLHVGASCSTNPPSVPTSEKIECGGELAQVNGIPIYSNGTGINSCTDEENRRHLAADGYSYGLKWQCVEFVRRYYKDYLNHTMPVQWGNAKDYFREEIKHGELNKERGLIQYRNNSPKKPQKNDILIFPKMAGGLGHVAIVTEIRDNSIVVAQQNASPAIATFELTNKNGIWSISNDCAGFLRKE